MDILLVDHPLVAARLSIMRDERTNNSSFRAALADLGTMLIYEASRDLRVEQFPLTTPVAATTGTRLADPPIIVPVVRAGLGMIDPALKMIPDAQVGFIGLARNEVTHEPVPYLEALPDDLSGRTVFVVDPMLADSCRPWCYGHHRGMHGFRPTGCRRPRPFGATGTAGDRHYRPRIER